MQKKLTYQELEEKIAYLEKKADFAVSLKREMEKNKQFLQILLNTIPSPIFYKDKAGVYQNCNDKFSQMILGIPKEKILQKSLFDLPDVIPTQLATTYYEKDQLLFDNPGVQVYEANVKCSDQKIRTFSFYKATVENEYQEVIGIVGVMLDITEFEKDRLKLHKTNQKLKNLSFTDSLTGLYNRRKFDEVFQHKLKISNRYNYLINFIMLDVDDFKLFNDTYGHSEGDKMLKRIAKSLKQTLMRPDDFVFRLGGEEFGLLFFSKDEASALKIAEAIRINVQNLNIAHINNKALNKVTISLGLVTVKHEIKDINVIYTKADDLLYLSKNSGKNKTSSCTL